MYPLECVGNFFLPIKVGQFEIIQLQATVDDITAVSRVVIIDDDFNKVRPDNYDSKKGLVDVKGLPNQKGLLEVTFRESIKTRKGVTVIQSTNVVPGTIKLFIR